jgi:hypothetical protein
MRRGAVLALLATAATLAAVAAASASTTTYRSGPLTATFTAGTHHPTCKQIWPITVTARYNGKPVRATAFYQFLLNGTVVGHQNPFSATPRNPHNHIWHFYGSFTDNGFGPFGALSVGEPLTVRAVVRVSHYIAYPGYRVTVVKVGSCPIVH